MVKLQKWYAFQVWHKQYKNMWFPTFLPFLPCCDECSWPDVYTSVFSPISRDIQTSIKPKQPSGVYICATEKHINLGHWNKDTEPELLSTQLTTILMAVECMKTTSRWLLALLPILFCGWHSAVCMCAHECRSQSQCCVSSSLILHLIF